eukprot:scpid100711/ scgid22615/ 
MAEAGVDDAVDRRVEPGQGDVPGQANDTPEADTGGAQANAANVTPRRRIQTLKDYTPENNPHHPDVHLVMKNLRHIGDHVNNFRYDMGKLEEGHHHQPDQTAALPGSRSHSEPLSEQYTHRHSKTDKKTSLPEDPASSGK